MKRRKVLIYGRANYLDKCIAYELLKKEFEVSLITHDKEKENFKSRLINIEYVDITNHVALKEKLKNIDTIICTNGISNIEKASITYKANLNLLYKAIGNGVRKFIYISNLNKQQHNYFWSCEENIFIEDIKQSGMNFCIIYPNRLYSDMLDFLKMAQKGKITLFGNGKIKINPIHYKDLAAVCVKAIYSKQTIIEAGGPEIYTHTEIAMQAFYVLNREPIINYYSNTSEKLFLWLIKILCPSKYLYSNRVFLNFLTMNAIAPPYGGSYGLRTYFEEEKEKI